MIFMSDPHFWHKRVREFCPTYRQQETLEEMNENIIAAWNARVTSDEMPGYILGDVCFGTVDQTRDVISRLRGKITFILGNHDYSKYRDALQERGEVRYYKEIKHNKTKICLMHYPILDWNDKGHGSIMLHGHEHGRLVDSEESRGKTMDVGWDVAGKVWHIDEIMEIMDEREIMALGHHEGGNVMRDAIKYPSTNQFRQAVSNVKQKLNFSHYDQEKQEPVFKVADSYEVEYVGTVKIHGTNGSVVWHSEDDVVFQSKSAVVAVGKDNMGFAGSMSNKNLSGILNEIKAICADNDIEFEFPVEIAGEWAGRGIQKGVAVTEVEPFFTVFRVAVGKVEGSGLKWIPPHLTYNVKDNDQRIYNIAQFGIHEIVIDFNNPAQVQNELIKLTEAVEAECPVGKFFGVSGIGEGIVWTPKDVEFAKDSGTWFKVKGEKHSSSKVKTLAAVDPERLANITEFVEYAVTENRLEQGIQEVGLDRTKIGEFVKWVATDIIKEETDVLEASKLTMKDVGKDISNKARQYYMNKL